MTSEQWKPMPVEDFGDRYEVSNLGNVRRKSRGPGTHPGRVRKLVENPNGYPWNDVAAFLGNGNGRHAPDKD